MVAVNVRVLFLASLIALSGPLPSLNAAPILWTTDATEVIDENDIDLTGIFAVQSRAN